MLLKDPTREFGWVIELKRLQCLGMGFIKTFFRKHIDGLVYFKRGDVIVMVFPDRLNEKYNEWMGCR